MKYYIINNLYEDFKLKPFNRPFEGPFNTEERAKAFIKKHNFFGEIVNEEDRELKRMKKGHVHCPVNEWDCPYYKNSCCTLYPMYNPAEECDDFAFFWDVDDDFICYDDHEKE